MKKYSVYQQISPDEKYTYKLLQLPSDLLRHISDNETDNLLIKSSTSTTSNPGQLVVCTDDKTWKLRQMNHSNTVLLLDNQNIVQHRKLDSILSDHNVSSDNNLIGFASCSYEYELTDSKGSIDITKLPRLHGDELRDSTNNVHAVQISVDELLENSPISRQEFFHEWYELGGCEIDGRAYILSPEYITEVLYTLITALISESFNYRTDTVAVDTIHQLSKKQLNFADSIVTTIVQKFTVRSDKPNEVLLDNDKIAKWFGIHVLSERATLLLSSKEFLIQWKSSLPAFYNVSLDLHYLRGYYCMPVEDNLIYINRDHLSTTLSARFVELFQLDREWNYDDFVPFIKDLVPPGVKVDLMILKFGKKKKIGKDRFVVTPR